MLADVFVGFDVALLLTEIAEVVAIGEKLVVDSFATTEEPFLLGGDLSRRALRPFPPCRVGLSFVLAGSVIVEGDDDFAVSEEVGVFRAKGADADRPDDDVISPEGEFEFVTRAVTPVSHDAGRIE
jgi:hypothetical protein